MKFIKLMTLAGLLGIAPIAFAAGDCKPVQGHLTSTVVSVFSDGTPCTSPFGICSEGRFTGRLKGQFRFVANALHPFAAIDPTAPLDVAATTGVITVESSYCGGTLVLDDTSAFSLGEDGFFASLQTPNGALSGGGCTGASGRIRAQGVFIGGCVDCKYVGEICGVGPSPDDDDDD